MLFNRSTAFLAMLALLGCGSAPRTAQAGPLLDWLCGRSTTAPITPVGAPVPVGNAPFANGYAAGYGATPLVQPSMAAYPAANYAGGYAGNYGTYYSSQLPVIGPAGAGYTAPMPSGIAAATMPASMPPTLSYVPNFQTQSQRTPVTYYRPLLTTDPNTGAQVVAMAPCTSYEMTAQRVPTLGRSALFGSNTAPAFQPPSQALPTYTLPSGGVPLAYATPSITAPYSTAYGVYGSSNTAGSYSTLQPGLAQPGMLQPAPTAGAVAPYTTAPAGAYPTTPAAQTPYYGTENGSSCGTYSPSPWQPVPAGTPGLVAPQAPPSQYPAQTTPDNSQPGFTPVPSGTVAPPTSLPPGVYPPSGSGSSDPADMPPSLPGLGTSAASGRQFNSQLDSQHDHSQHASSTPTDAAAQASQRPQLRSIVRYPSSAAQSSSNTSPAHDSGIDHASDNGTANRDGRGNVPAMLPIPAPQDFHHEPRWNPGLLREEDMTALRPSDARAQQLAGHAKPIVWASFEAPQRDVDHSQAMAQDRSLVVTSQPAPAASSPAASQLNQLRRIVRSAAPVPTSSSQALPAQSSTSAPSATQPLHAATGIQRLPESRLTPTRDESIRATGPRRDASGWKASR